MHMRILKTGLAFFAMIGVFVLLNNSQVSIPPLGKFMNPFTGFWQNGQQQDSPPELLDVHGLRDEVLVVWDERQVPHVFASNTYDIYFAQGFLTARHRLWQMEFQTHVAAGRVSEIIGAKAVEFDRKQRRNGLLLGAEQSLQMMRRNPETQLILQAYANGVNTWIDQLTPATLPLEYKLLNYEPEVWSTLKTALLLKYMVWDLTGRNSEMDLSVIRAALGQDFVDRFYPEDTPRTDPVIPNAKPWRFDPLVSETPAPAFEPAFVTALRKGEPDEDNGSNNWAVSGKKTRSGAPILANDPHLGLNLPSIWYEIQLNTPDMNVYGVSLPGAPAVIIGFNENIAWGLTNAGSDVMDWFQVEFKDDSYTEYRYMDAWVPATQRIEEIAVRGGGVVLDTIPMTRFGPLVRYGEHHLENGNPVGLAMRWIAHDPSNEMEAIRSINLASNADEFFGALDRFDAPGQNFVFAARDGDVAIRHNGKFPLRAQDQGKFVRAGRDTTGEWRQFIPRNQLPAISNPWRGFVSSANQNPVGETYPYYLGWDYEDYERGDRINRRLTKMERVTMDDMQKLHMDNYNTQAALVLPFLLKQLEGLNEEQTQIYNDLKAWDYFARADSRPAWVYKQWWLAIEKAIWMDELTLFGEVRKFPTRSVTAERLLKDSKLKYYDDITTDEVEDRKAIVNRAFRSAIQTLTEDLGPYGDQWALGQARGTDINHLLKVGGLGRPGLPTGGGQGIVNATKKDHGPSWRMVVELGKEMKARGVYPGGQSGNPGSAFYDNAINDWVQGNYYELYFMQSPADATPKKHMLTSLRNYQ
jgi:penicillin amidase